MKCKITELGVSLIYDPELPGMIRTRRHYFLEDFIGRCDVFEEMDEDEIVTGEYDIPDDKVEAIFNREVEDNEDYLLGSTSSQQGGPRTKRQVCEIAARCWA